MVMEIETAARLKLFKWLVHYHCRVNLPKCLPYLSDGKLYVRGQALQEAFDENELYKGLLLVAGADVRVERLIREGLLFDEPTAFVGIPEEEFFFSYLRNQQNGDGAYLVDHSARRIAHVLEMNNAPPQIMIGGTAANTLGINVYQKLPPDFVSAKGDVTTRNIGTKTRLAIKIPLAYHGLETYQIKRSAYTPFGMGKVTHFDRHGLREEFYFVHDDEKVTPFVEDAIVGVYVKYAVDEAGYLYKVLEKRFPLNTICSWLESVEAEQILV